MYGYNSPVQLFFIRHGQSRNNALYAATGGAQGRSQDPELTPTGHQQAERVASYLRQPDLYRPSYLYLSSRPESGHLVAQHNSLTHLYCSLMVRAAATATLISAAIGVPAVACRDLHEAGGVYLDQPVEDPESPGAIRNVPIGLPGNGRSFFEQQFPDLVLPDDLDENGWWNRPFETMVERAPRAKRVLKALIQQHGEVNPDGSEDRVALVSHGGFYNHFLRAVLGFPPRRSDKELAEVWFEINNTAITRIDYLDGHYIVLYMNDTHFLPAEWVT
jgi:2,3-bisphosphoglycerate-dependent phosphoglycerate mutase